MDQNQPEIWTKICPKYRPKSGPKYGLEYGILQKNPLSFKHKSAQKIMGVIKDICVMNNTNAFSLI